MATLGTNGNRRMLEIRGWREIAVVTVSSAVIANAIMDAK
jgi:hypothetical protein